MTLLLRMALLTAILAALGSMSIAGAQTAAPVSEEFDLNIDQKKIVESDFYRALSAVMHTEKFYVEAGAVVSASRITVTIRNATGHVRFRASLDELERVLRRRR